jgi:hypothetical protein
MAAVIRDAGSNPFRACVPVRREYRSRAWRVLLASIGVLGLSTAVEVGVD